MDLQDLSRRLFAAADWLRTNSALRPERYAQPALAPIALRQIQAKIEKARAELARKFTPGRLKPQPAEYGARAAVFLTESAGFSRRRGSAGGSARRLRRPAGRGWVRCAWSAGYVPR